MLLLLSVSVYKTFNLTVMGEPFGHLKFPCGRQVHKLIDASNGCHLNYVDMGPESSSRS